MITVLLQGRLGNNLFQYAAGRALAIKHGTDLVLDTSWVSKEMDQHMRLIQTLPIKAKFKRSLPNTKKALHKLCHWGPHQWHRGHGFEEDGPGYDAAFTDLPDDSLMIGYFQNQRYFSDIEPTIRKELDLSHVELPVAASELRCSLKAAPTASLHVRRGDYLHTSTTQCLDEHYHDLAIQQMRTLHPSICFCIFSDDIPWCRTRFVGDEFLFADFPEAQANPLIDLRLMSTCDYHIIVNSSFSWWGAWLNPKPNKTVICPSMWMKSLKSTDIVPSEWTIL